MKEVDPVEAAKWAGYYKKFGGESDIASAIVGALILEHALREMVKKAGILMKRTDFFDFIEKAYELKFIDQREKNDLDLVRKIRNEFAHNLDSSFANARIKKYCSKLEFANGTFANDATAHKRFLATVGLMRYAFTIRLMTGNSPQQDDNILPRPLDLHSNTLKLP